MDNPVSRFAESVKHILDQIVSVNAEALDTAGDLAAEVIAGDDLVHIIGTGGHSTLGPQEIFWRAGCLAAVNPLLPPSLLIPMGARTSNVMERSSGIASAVLDSYRIPSGALLIIVNAYGINPMTIETALECRKRGITTIGVTATSFAENVPKGAPSRHPSGANLHELVDHFLDTRMPYGDACVEIPGVDAKAAPVSTITNSFALHMLMIRTVEKLAARGISPPIWTSANIPGGDEANEAMHKKYDSRVRHLG